LRLKKLKQRQSMQYISLYKNMLHWSAVSVYSGAIVEQGKTIRVKLNNKESLSFVDMKCQRRFCIINGITGDI